ncbi:Hypothetical protein HVR_LOCUS705 [uncultured virus]|nr:Hypothetical protein HVR_LOCUS705 [uncultured virus]
MPFEKLLEQYETLIKTQELPEEIFISIRQCFDGQGIEIEKLSHREKLHQIRLILKNKQFMKHYEFISEINGRLIAESETQSTI